MSRKGNLVRFLKHKLLLTGLDSDEVRRSKLLNLFIFISGLVSFFIILIPPIFNLLNISFGFKTGILPIYIKSLIMLVSSAFILCVKKFYSKKLANVLFLFLVTILIFFQNLIYMYLG